MNPPGRQDLGGAPTFPPFFNMSSCMIGQRVVFVIAETTEYSRKREMEFYKDHWENASFLSQINIINGRLDNGNNCMYKLKVYNYHYDNLIVVLMNITGKACKLGMFLDYSNFCSH